MTAYSLELQAVIVSTFSCYKKYISVKFEVHSKYYTRNFLLLFLAQVRIFGHKKIYCFYGKKQGCVIYSLQSFKG